MTNTPALDLSWTFAGDLLASLRAERDRRESAELVRARLVQRDAIALSLEGELATPPLDVHTRALARAFGVPVEAISAAVAIEIARARLQENDARRAVLQGGKP